MEPMRMSQACFHLLVNQHDRLISDSVSVCYCSQTNRMGFICRGLTESTDLIVTTT